MQTRNFPRLAISLLALTCLISVILVACSPGPLVTHSAISGEVRSIANWKVVWPDSAAWANAVTMNAPSEIRAKRTEANNYMLAYVDDVRQNLTESYGLPGLDNQPLSGYLLLYITPQGFNSPLRSSDTTRNGYLQSEVDTRNRVNHESPNSMGLAYAAVGALSMLLDNGKCISRVEVQLVSPTGKSLGWTVLRGQNAVKTKHVASTIWNLLSTGQK